MSLFPLMMHCSCFSIWKRTVTFSLMERLFTTLLIIMQFSFFFNQLSLYIHFTKNYITLIYLLTWSCWCSDNSSWLHLMMGRNLLSWIHCCDVTTSTVSLIKTHKHSFLKLSHCNIYSSLMWQRNLLLWMHDWLHFFVSC